QGDAVGDVEETFAHGIGVSQDSFAAMVEQKYPRNKSRTHGRALPSAPRDPIRSAAVLASGFSA
ncbi:MAG: hypothetical protein MUE59_02055, partial [Thiobacillaceae bacterium]|nr:hypothetical protein [Thiobacillaceae bacterium]